MRVVLTVNFSPWSPYSGGGQRSTHNLACALAKRGHAVTVVYTKAASERIEPDEPPPYEIRWARIVGRKSRRDNPLRPLNAMTVATELNRLLAEGGVQVIHGNGEEAALCPALRQRYRFVFVMTPRYPSYPAPLLRPGGPTRWDQAKLLAGDAKYLVLAAALRGADWICPTSEYAANQVCSAYQIDRTKIRVIPNGVDSAFTRTKWSAEQARHGPLVFFGRLERSKGVDVLLDALARLPDAPPCKIVGRGEEEDALRSRIAELGLGDRVECIGWRTANEVAALVRTARAVVLPSREESFGNAMAEAMAVGVPVVSTRAGSIPELIDDGRTGVLAAPGDPISLAEAVSRVLADDAQAQRMGSDARNEACERYTWDSVAAAFETCYAHVR